MKRYVGVMGVLKASAIIVALLVGSVAVSSASVAQVKASQQETARTFDLPFELVDNRIIVSARMNGVGPLRFILDTGADEGYLTHATAERLHLKVAGEEDGHGTGATTLRMGRAEVGEIRLGEAVFHNWPMALLMSDEPDNVFGSRAPDGVIGKPVFDRYAVRVDYQRKVLTLTPAAQYVAPAGAVVVRFDLPLQIPVIDAELDGVRGRFGVDTGARSSLLVYGPFAAEHKLKEKYGAKLEGVTGWGLGGPIRSLLARSQHFLIGGFDVQGSVVRLSTLTTGLTTSSEMAGLIGPDILERFVVTFDYSRRQMLLEKSNGFCACG